MTVSWNTRFDWVTVAGNLLMLQGIWQSGIKPIIVPTWSLSFEWAFYIAFPAVLLLRGDKRRITLTHLGLVAIVIIAALVPMGFNYIRSLMFVSGAALACMQPTEARRLVRRVPDAIVVGVYVLVNLMFVAQQNYTLFIPFYVFTCFLLVAKVVYGDGVLHDLFSNALMRYVGNVSYSFYLFHGLMIIVVCEYLGPHLAMLPDPVKFIVLFLTAFFSSCAVAALSYALFEKPYFAHRAKARDLQQPTRAMSTG